MDDKFIRHLLAADDPIVRGTLASLDLARLPTLQSPPDMGAPHVGGLVDRAFSLARDMGLRQVGAGVMLLAACQGSSDLVEGVLGVDAGTVQILAERLTRALKAFEGEP